MPDQVGVSVGGEEDDVLHAREVVEELRPLGGIALPAVVGQLVELLDRNLVDDDLPGRVRGPDRLH